jgi:hypothetical protein
MTMIAVIADPADHGIVREFFELFKTPWEFYRTGRRYDVLLCMGGARVSGTEAHLTVAYVAGETPVDDLTGVTITSRRTNVTLSYGESRVPIYGDSITFDRGGLGLVTADFLRQSAAYMASVGGGTFVRVGYDLLREVHTLLTEGQPPVNADVPTLDLHIALLRELITAAGIPLVEIPPIPLRSRFIACMTHDVDHASLRRHTWDHTVFGFLYRACIGSFINLLRGRASWQDLLTNWAAALRLPFIHLGLARDFWRELHRYLDVDPPASSTFFVIPFKNDPGRTVGRAAPRVRASRYGARDIATEIRGLASAGCEIGVHGLDAWLDSARGYEELYEVAQITCTSDIGVRIHWLYGGEQSPAILEKAGFAYDSTNGYNETIGYRAGTTQVFRPFDALRLLELPLHIMDTALFYPSHLNLSPRQARERMDVIVDNAARLGGTVTVNWHDRSIAPERLWNKPYSDLVQRLRQTGAWFATGSGAVAWFRQRRSAAFESVTWQPGVVRARVSFESGNTLPGLRLRVHRAGLRQARDLLGHPERYVDIAIVDGMEACARI